MSEENVETVRRVYDCLARRDWDAMCQAFLEDQISPFESSTAEPVDVFEGGEQVAVYVKIRSRPKESSAEIEALVGHLFTLRDGLIVRLQTFPKREKALEAAGLSE
jgi:ketosteroid isomerase-like protein